MKYLIIILSLNLIGCCTKKDCGFTEIISVRVKISTDTATGFSSDRIKNMTVKILNKSFVPVDSVQPFLDWDTFDTINFRPIIQIDKYFINNTGHSDISQFNYSFHIQDSLKTFVLSDIQYDLISQKVKCNSCFPFGDGSATHTKVMDFKLIFNSLTYANMAEPLIIQK